MGDTIREDLNEDATRGESHAILVLPIQAAKLPALAVFEVFEEAVASAGPCACFNRIAAVFPSQPNRLQVPLAPVAGRYKTARDEPLGRGESAESE